MNEITNAIKNRRSIRKFKNDKIPDSDIDEIIECALSAPSADNQQKWYFTVLQNKELIQILEDTIKNELANSKDRLMRSLATDDNYTVFGNAPTVIFITADSTAFSNYVEFDCAAAAENIMIAAQSMNIGSHVMTVTELLFSSNRKTEFEKKLSIPRGYRHVCSIALGYSNEIPRPKITMKDVVTIIR